MTKKHYIKLAEGYKRRIKMLVSAKSTEDYVAGYTMAIISFSHMEKEINQKFDRKGFLKGCGV